jgi:hypothetical protein
MAYSTDELSEELERARRKMPAPAYENHPFTHAVNGYDELEAACTAYKGELELTANELGAESPAHIRDEIRALRAANARLRAACEATERYLRLEIPYAPTEAGDTRFGEVVRQLRAALADE